MKLVEINNAQNTNWIAGKSFCFTGELSLTRNEISEFVSRVGGIVKSTVTNNLDYLVVGYKSGSKETKARNLGVKILTEEQFVDMLK